MAGQVSTFVFIDEDQQKKYSKSTLSAINAQVAKYAHKQRQTPPKSNSAPSSPPEVGLISTQPIIIHADSSTQKCRRKSDTICASTSRKVPDTKLSQSCRPERQTRDRPPRRVNLQRKSSRDKEIPKATTTDDSQHNDTTTSENLTDSLENLNRITKLPSYQAFPFFLDREERRLAHYWFTEVLREDFGINKLQLEDSFQGSLTKYPLAFQVPLRWIIAHSAQRLYNKTGVQSLAMVYRSQQLALKKLQDILTDENTPTDEAISSIQYSIVHNPEFRKIHLRGMDALIEARGGLETVHKQCTVSQPDHLFLQYTFADFDITQFEELERLKSEFFQALLTIQQSATEYLQIKFYTENWASTIDLADCRDHGTFDMQKWLYTEQRARVFGPQTTMGQLIRQNIDRNANMIVKSRLFGALFQLAAILLEYETIEEKSIFLRQLEKSANNIANSCLDPATGLPRIMAGASIFMVGHVTRQVQKELRPEASEKGVRAAMIGISALKIFGLLTDSMRERLHTYLQSWLLGIGNAQLNPGDINTLSEVITQLWMQQDRSPFSPQAEAPDYFTVKNDFPQDKDVSVTIVEDFSEYPESDYIQAEDQHTSYVGMVNG